MASAPEEPRPDQTRYLETTEGIQIEVLPRFLPSESVPDQNLFVFSYTITLTNVGKITTQLLTRHWIITDGEGQQRDVRGPGVVGNQPILEPGQKFTYTSFCPLQTPTGDMKGSYQMMDENGRRYDVKVPQFHFRHPSQFH